MFRNSTKGNLKTKTETKISMLVEFKSFVPYSYSKCKIQSTLSHININPHARYIASVPITNYSFKLKITEDAKGTTKTDKAIINTRLRHNTSVGFSR